MELEAAIALRRQADAGAAHEEPADAVLRAGEGGIGRAETLRIPEVHARLVADLDQSVEVGEQRAAALDDGILRLPWIGCNCAGRT